MTDQTDITLKHWRTVPFSYEHGEDCLMSIANHIQQSTGIDAGEPWRGKYRTETDALMHVAAWGGPVNMIDQCGLARTDEPRRGDVVVIDVHGMQIGAVHTGDSVAFRLARGVGELNAKLVRIIAAWRVE